MCNKLIKPSQPCSKNIKNENCYIMSYNSGGLPFERKALIKSELFAKYSPAVVCFQETFLVNNKKTLGEALNLQKFGYLFKEKQRQNQHCGGVAMCYKSELNLVEVVLPEKF